MVKTTQLKQNDGLYEIEISEEYVTKLSWENGYLIEIYVVDDKLVIKKLSGFIGM